MRSTVMKVLNLLALCLCLFFTGFLCYRGVWVGGMSTLLLTSIFAYIGYTDFFSSKT